MKEKLIIKNFGPLKSVELDLGKITVLIGEQATGKSTVAKVLSICRYFSYIVDYNPLERGSVGRLEGAFYKGLVEWGIGSYKKKDTYIYYENSDYSVKVTAELELVNVDLDNKENYIKKEIPLLYCELNAKSDRFKNLLDELEEIKPKFDKSLITIDSSWMPSENFFRLNVKEIMNNPFYFPTERGLQSIFSLGKSSIQNLSDSLFNQLAKLDGIARYFKEETFIEPFGVYYKNINGQGYIRKQDEEDFYSLFNGASGYQSTIPIVLAVKYYNEVEKRRKTFIIEESEQNLFPKTQKKLIEFMVESVNKFDNQFILPTHSPYILTSLSNLIYAHKLGTSEKRMFQKEVHKIIPKESWIDVNDISVYYLNNGEAKDLVDVEECLINLDDLDNVSEIINTKFDALLEIDIALEKEIK